MFAKSLCECNEHGEIEDFGVSAYAPFVGGKMLFDHNIIKYHYSPVVSAPGEEEEFIMARILVVEDEETIRNLICWNLELVGHSSSSAADGWEAKRMLENQQFDLILLDVMLPGIDGFRLAEYCSGTPVMFVTAKDEIQDKMRGFQAGAEDYLVKPFEIVELLARIHVILRRNGADESGIRIGDVRIDMTSRVVYREGVEMELTPQEYELFEALVRNRNIALSREKLLELAWGFDYEGDTRTVDVHIQKLRQKLGLEKAIKTVYKVGYRLEEM